MSFILQLFISRVNIRKTARNNYFTIIHHHIINSYIWDFLTADLDPDFGAYPEENTITESKAYIKVPCQPPASNPPAKINWYKDGKLIEVSNFRYFVEL